jgi:hypothetical protein
MSNSSAPLASIADTVPSGVFLHWSEGDFHDSFDHGCEDASLTAAQFDDVLRAALASQDRADQQYPEYVGCYCKVKALLNYADGTKAEWRFDVNAGLNLSREFAEARISALRAKASRIADQLGASGSYA